MGRFHLEQLANHLAQLDRAVIALWIGLAVLSVTLFVLSRTRWGQERPLRKCFVLSLLAHVLLMGYATTVKIVSGIPVRDPAPVMNVALDDGNPWETPVEEPGAPVPSPWASHHHDSPTAPEPLEVERADLADENESARPSQAEELGTVPISPAQRVAMLGPVQPEPNSPGASVERESASAEDATPIDAPKPERRDVPDGHVPDVKSERIEVAASDEGNRSARRNVADEIAASLLRQHMPMPRLSDVPVTVEPNRVLAGPEDAALTGRNRPAELNESPVSGSDSGTGEMQPSSLTSAAPPPAASLANMTSVAMSNLVDVAPLDRGSDTIGPPVLGQARLPQKTEDVPRVYQLRVAPNRSEIALRYGATNESEAAVRTALKWLAENQDRDGRWDPARHEGGKEQRVLGRDRFGAGAKAETGISGLALLAFLASGHTHEEGLYRENVQRGL